MSISAAGDRISRHRYRDIIYLFTVNTAALILNPIVVAYSMDPLLVTFWRCFFGALIFIPIALFTQRGFYRKIAKAQWGYMIIAGAALSIHFIGLMQGLYQVSLGIALTIMSTGAIWIGLIGIVILKQVFTAGQWTGLVAGVGGIVLYAYVGNSFEARNSAALLWLLASAISGAVYVVIGQKVRATITNFAYVSIVFSVAALISLTYSVITQNSIRVEESGDWVGILLITFLGQILVHAVSNLYLKHGEAAILQLTTLIQIPLVAVIGWVLFDQQIGLEVIPALILTIVGLIIFNLAQPKVSTSEN
jgi:drug/metabolite transporter (DMT)-like permease